VSGSAGRGSPRAAAVLAVVALAGAAPRAGPTAATCPVPIEVPGTAGTLLAVHCDAGARGAPPAGAARLLFGLGIDPNHASARTLEALPGIGPGRAAAIVQEARAHPLCNTRDLERVPGIGPATGARVAPWLAPGADCP
jgi:hypothetical protein